MGLLLLTKADSYKQVRNRGLPAHVFFYSDHLFDQIVFTGNLLGTDRSTLKFYKHEIFSRDFMFQKEGKYKGYPKRTQAGGVWLNGYSDHLPTIIYLIKEVK